MKNLYKLIVLAFQLFSLSIVSSAQWIKFSVPVGPFCIGQNYIVNFTDSLIGDFNSVSVHISNSSGLFPSGGTLLSTTSSNADTITINVPSYFVAGSFYRLRIHSGGYYDTSSFVRINGLPFTSFSANNSNTCAGTPIILMNTTTGGTPPLTYEWIFTGTNAPPTNYQVNPIIQFTPPAGNGTVSYNIQLYATDANGCKYLYTTVPFLVKQKPYPILLDSNTLANPPFSTCSSTPPNPYRLTVLNASLFPGIITNYNISWGDGTFSFPSTSFSQISHLYYNKGLYNLTMDVVGTNGCTNSISYNVAYQQPPTVSVSSPSIRIACNTHTMPFVLGNYINNTLGTYYVWNFGDSTPTVRWDVVTNDTIWHTYNTASCKGTQKYFTARIKAYNACDSSSAKVDSIYIWMKPKASFRINPDSIICAGSTATLSNLTTPGSFGNNCSPATAYYWQFTGASISNYTGTNPPQLTFNTPGSFILRLIAANSCGNDTIYKTICVQPSPINSYTIAVSPSSGCTNATVTTNNTSNLSSGCGNYPYSWQILKGGTRTYTGYTYISNTDSNSVNPMLLFTKSGNYTIRLNISNKCGNNFNKDTIISIKESPIITFPADVTYCDSTVVNFTPTNTIHFPIVDSGNSNITNVAWSISPSGFYVLNSNTANPIIAFPNSTTSPKYYQIVYSAQNVCGISIPDTQNIIINPKPRVFATTTSSNICSTDSAIINFTSNLASGVKFKWTVSASSAFVSGFNNSAGFDTLFSIKQKLTNASNVVQTVRYYITPKHISTNCQGDSITVIILVKPRPQITARDTTICSGLSPNIQLNSTVSGTLFTWTTTLQFGNAGGYSNQSTPISLGINQTLYNLGLYTAQIKYSISGISNGCSALFDPNIFVSINPVPDIINSLLTQTICSGDTVKFIPIGTFPQTVYYYVANLISGPANGYSGGIGTISQVIYTTTSATTNLRYTYTPVGIAPTYCTGTSRYFDVTVKPKPVISVAPSNQSVCSGTPITIALSSNLSLTKYTWNANLINGSQTSGFFNQSTLTDSANIKQTIFNSSTSPSIINYKIHSNTMNCIGDSVTASVTINPLPIVNAGIDITRCKYQGIFSLVGSPVGGRWTGTGVISDTSFNPSIVNAGLYTMYYEFTDFRGCSNSDTLVITVVDVLLANAGSDIIRCENSDTFRLIGLPVGGIWTGTAVTSIGVFNSNIAGVGVFNLVYTYTAGNGCSASDSMQISVKPKSRADFILTSQVCPNTLINVNATSTDSITNYIWRATNSGLFNNTIFADSVTKNTSVLLPENESSSDAIYTLKLFTKTNFNCFDTISKNTTLRRRPFAQFNTGSIKNCGPVVYTMSNYTSNVNCSYFWTSIPSTNVNIVFVSDSNPSITLPVNNTNAAITYKINLFATRYDATLACIDSASQNIVIYPKPYIQFVFIPADSGCTPFSYSTFNSSNPLNSESNTSLKYLWKMPNNATDTLQNISRTIINSGFADSTFTVKLTATTQWGCKDSIERNIKVLNNQIKSAFKISSLMGCVPFSIAIYDSSSGAKNIRYKFGDSTNSTIRNPLHLYPLVGNYTVQQIATNYCNADTSFQIVTALSLPQATIQKQPVACRYKNVNFNVSFKDTGFVMWYFGDGDSSSTINPTHAYNTIGKKIITLKLTSFANGCISLIRDSILINALPTSSIVSDKDAACNYYNFSFTGNSNTGNLFEWDFGDTQIGTGKNINHLFNDSGLFFVKLRVTNSNGCVDSIYKTITVFKSPRTSYTASPADTCRGPVTVKFNNTSTNASNYIWSFGNSQNSTLTNPSTYYSTAKDYNVTLISFNTNNCYDTLISVYRVYPSPKSNFTYDFLSGCQPLQVNFTNKSLNAISYRWYFGDGGNAILQDPSHIYTSYGMFNVSLVAIASNLCTDSFTVNNAVDVYQTPLSDFSFKIDSIELPFGLVYFTNKSFQANQFQWYFGDGGFSSQFSPTYRYRYSDTFKVSMIAFYGNLCSDTANAEVFIPHYYKGLFVPNAFVPDGVNKLFLAVGAELKNYHLRIYNRWGEIVWQTNALSAIGEPTEGWDGKDANGIFCPIGTYTWQIDATFTDGIDWRGMSVGSNKYSKTGVIYLMR